MVGIVVSFALCGVIALAGKRGSAPTMVLSRAAFGVRGNRLPSALSWLLTVGWETVLVVLATLATATVFNELGWGGGDGIKIVALLVVSAITVAAGVAGFETVMRVQAVITVVAGVLTVVYMILAADDIHWGVVSARPAGSLQQQIGALVFVMTGFGLGLGERRRRLLALPAAQRARPRRVRLDDVRRRGRAGDPGLFGLLLAGSSTKLSDAIALDPIGALTTILPTWFLVPFAITAVLGLIGGAVLDIYSSGLALLSAGLRIPRYIAAGVDGVIMVAGTIYVVFFTDNFLAQFQGFLITLGVPIAAWCGVMLADVALRRGDYAEPELFDPAGRYGDVRVLPLALVAGGPGDRLGARDQQRRRLARLAGLPARAARPGREGRRVGVRRPRRPRGAGDRPARHADRHAQPRARPGGDPGGARGLFVAAGAVDVARRDGGDDERSELVHAGLTGTRREN